MCIIYIYIVDSCLLNHVMPAVPHRSLFVTLGRETLIRASAAALVLNFAGESPGGSGRASGRGPKIADLYGIYMDLLWDYPRLSHLLIFCCRLEVYTHGKWWSIIRSVKTQAAIEFVCEIHRCTQVHWQHWVTDRADCWVWCLSSKESNGQVSRDQLMGKIGQIDKTCFPEIGVPLNHPC